MLKISNAQPSFSGYRSRVWSVIGRSITHLDLACGCLSRMVFHRIDVLWHAAARTSLERYEVIACNEPMDTKKRSAGKQNLAM